MAGESEWFPYLLQGGWLKQQGSIQQQVILAQSLDTDVFHGCNSRHRPASLRPGINLTASVRISMIEGMPGIKVARSQVPFIDVVAAQLWHCFNTATKGLNHIGNAPNYRTRTDVWVLTRFDKSYRVVHLFNRAFDRVLTINVIEDFQFA